MKQFWEPNGFLPVAPLMWLVEKLCLVQRIAENKTCDICLKSYLSFLEHLHSMAQKTMQDGAKEWESSPETTGRRKARVFPLTAEIWEVQWHWGAVAAVMNQVICIYNIYEHCCLLNLPDCRSSLHGYYLLRFCPKGWVLRKRWVLKGRNIMHLYSAEFSYCLLEHGEVRLSQWRYPLHKWPCTQCILLLGWLLVSIPQLHDVKSSWLPAAEEEKLICRCWIWHLQRSCVQLGYGIVVNDIASAYVAT